MNEVRAWRCRNGHTMGLTGRNGNGIRQLMVYRQAMDAADLQDPPDVMAVVEGLVMDVRCSVCGEMRTWVPGQESIDRLVARVERREEVGIEQSGCG